MIELCEFHPQNDLHIASHLKSNKKQAMFFHLKCQANVILALMCAQNHTFTNVEL